MSQLNLELRHVALQEGKRRSGEVVLRVGFDLGEVVLRVVFFLFFFFSLIFFLLFFFQALASLFSILSARYCAAQIIVEMWTNWKRLWDR